MNPIETLTGLLSHKNEVISANAKQAITYSTALVNGEINKDEYKDLIEGLHRTEIISESADDLADIIMLNESLTALFNLGKIITAQ